MNKYSISDADTCPKPDISVFSPESTEFCFSRDMTVLTMNRSPDHYCHAHSHSHPNYEFCLPLTPIPFMTVGEQIYFGEVGWVIPAPDGCAHGLMYDLSDISLQILTVRSEFFITLMREKGFSGEYPVLPVRAGEDLRLYISAFRREYSLGASRDRHKLRHLTALICDELIDAAIRGDIYTGRDRIGYRRGIRSAAEFFRNNFKQPISLDGIAEMCGISRNYFTSGFRRLYGVTPLVYLTGLRITEAKRLLETTNNTVGEIAAKCGYTHANSFTQAFRMTVGINPSEYRRSKR